MVISLISLPRILQTTIRTPVTATTLTKSPDLNMQGSRDEISGGVEGQLDVDRGYTGDMAGEGADASREIILKQPDINDVIKPR